MAEVRLPPEISIFALSACSKATLHITLLALILSESSNGVSTINSKSLISSSADRDKRLFINGFPSHNVGCSAVLFTRFQKFCDLTRYLVNRVRGSAASDFVGKRGTKVDNLLLCDVVPYGKKDLLTRHGSSDNAI